MLLPKAVMLRGSRIDHFIGAVEVQATYHWNNYPKGPNIQILLPSLGSKVYTYIYIHSTYFGLFSAQGLVMSHAFLWRPKNPVPRSEKQKRRTAPPHCEERRPTGLEVLGRVTLGVKGL